MNSTTWALTDDIAPAIAALLAGLLVLAAILLFFEVQRRERWRTLTFVTGMLAALALALAILRPVHVRAKSSTVGPRVLVLMDTSRRMLLPAGSTTRRARAGEALESIRRHLSDSRLSVLGFAGGRPEPYELASEGPRAYTGSSSDLTAALEELSRQPGERPSSIIVVSDGRLSRPAQDVTRTALRRALGDPRVAIHTVFAGDRAPSDASIRAVRAAGAAVAHQKLTLRVVVGCSLDLKCDEVPVAVRELRSGVPPAVLATGAAKVEAGEGTVELEITLDRAGNRVVEVAIEAPAGDEIEENDSRHLTFFVARDRVRLLHLAGRPTYDVRALRMWLKADESVDLVAFFILRGDNDDPAARDTDLALIRFPVDELFTQHLPSFDAVVLQDIDAVRYKLAQYLLRLAGYVNSGGGLIMVGGPSSFAGGNYAGTPLDSILPVEQVREKRTSDPAEFVPSYTESGRAAAVTRPLRELLGDALPSMPGSNLLGPARPGAVVLWEHPELTTSAGRMPILALGEAGDGRAIALGVDATHRLGFGELAASVGGRAYGALWDGLLGWLMRDPRYEAARAEIVGGCVAGQEAILRVTRLPGMSGEVGLKLERLGETEPQSIVRSGKGDANGPVDLPLPPLGPGGYSAKITVGSAPATRHDFGCEAGGVAWSDSRPDAERLERIAEVSGGVATTWAGIESIPAPRATQISAERHVSPVLPPWGWSLAAATLLGAHWLFRRQAGLV